MDAQPLDQAKSYLLKHTSQTVKARVKTIQHRVNMQTLDPEPASTLELNSIGVVELETTRPLFLDSYDAHRLTGSFILIDPVSHATVAAGMVREILTAGKDAKPRRRSPSATLSCCAGLRPHCAQAGIDVVRTRTSDRGLLQRLLHVGVVVLIESEGLDDFPARSRSPDLPPSSSSR